MSKTKPWDANLTAAGRLAVRSVSDEDARAICNEYGIKWSKVSATGHAEYNQPTNPNACPPTPSVIVTLWKNTNGWRVATDVRNKPVIDQIVGDIPDHEAEVIPATNTKPRQTEDVVSWVTVLDTRVLLAVYHAKIDVVALVKDELKSRMLDDTGQYLGPKTEEYWSNKEGGRRG